MSAGRRRPARTAATALGALLLVAPAGAAGAEEFPQRGTGRPTFLVDVVALPLGPDSAQVDVTWEVPYGQLTFHQDDDWYRAQYDVTVVLSSHGRQVTGDVWDRRVRVATFAEARGSRLAKGKETLAVPVGKYDVRVTVTDRNSRSTSTAGAKLEARFGPTRIGLSEIHFLRYTETGPEPNPGRDLPAGEPGNLARVVVHPELAEAASYVVRWRIEGAGERSVMTGDTTVVLRSDPVPVDLPVDTSGLTVGAHRLEVRLEGVGGGAQESRKTTFFVRLTPRWFTDHRDEAQEVFDVIAPNDEARELHDAAPSEWAAKVEAYWLRHDPDPSTPRNEYREDIQERMEAAATLFDEPFRRPGWRTDRGLIFLKYGRPARRTVRTSDFEGPASELWEYDSPRRLFFFVDERGSGEFWLRV